VISIDVLNQIKAIRLNELYEFTLHRQVSFDVLDSLLHYSASITVLRKLKDALFYHFKESLLVNILSTLKQLLEDIISKLVLG
jgi:hypothetical protein